MATFTPPVGHRTFLKGPDIARCRRHVDGLAKTIAEVRAGHMSPKALDFYAEIAHLHVGHLDVEDAICAISAHFKYYRTPVNVPEKAPEQMAAAVPEHA